MVIWLFSYWDSVREVANNAGSEIERAGAAIAEIIGAVEFLSGNVALLAELKG